ncbi:MAG: UDP-glucose dehydrogenase family protein [Actinomycetota bacterium]
MRISVIGAGHAGLVAAASLASLDRSVDVLDIDRSRIGALRRGIVPFLEPGLEDLVRDSIAKGRLRFETDASSSLANADVIMVCVGTPDDGTGQVDLSAVVDAVRSVARHARDGATLVNRSTAPVGTAAFLRDLLDEQRPGSIDVAVNPEFLAEGTGVRDFLHPDRIVVGAWTGASVAVLRELYEPILRAEPEGARVDPLVPFVVTDPPTAELTKYAANAFLAVKISFINEIACIAEEFGADVTQVAEGIGADRRIGPAFLRAGVGWGGSCFPKDILALQGSAETRGVAARMLRAANEVNADQHRWVIRKLQTHLKTLVGRRVGLLGLSFKVDTDDTRHAPAIEIISRLAKLGVRVTAYDPAVKRVPTEVAGQLTLAPDPETLASGVDALVLVTEWSEFLDIDFSTLAATMRTPLLLDGRNALDPERAQAAGLIYIGVGREPVPSWRPGPGARSDTAAESEQTPPLGGRVRVDAR